MGGRATSISPFEPLRLDRAYMDQREQEMEQEIESRRRESCRSGATVERAIATIPARHANQYPGYTEGFVHRSGHRSHNDPWYWTKVGQPWRHWKQQTGSYPPDYERASACGPGEAMRVKCLP